MQDIGERLRCCTFAAIFSVAIYSPAAFAAAANSESATLAGAVSFQIGAQSIVDALKQFASQSGIQLIYETPDILDGTRTDGLVGTFTPEAALTQLLAHTNLQYRFLNGRTVAIHQARAEVSSPPLTNQRSAPSRQTPASQDSRSETVTLSEVVVTAQKRTELLQDVPVPVTAISGATLLDSNLTRIEDFYTSVPGLNVTQDDLLGTSRLTIRGLSTGGFSNPTVGIIVDDVPYGSSSGVASGYVAPDIDPSELARVEVLRGPQGTLYGASSMGGLLKYVTVDPSTDALSGHLQGNVNTIHNGDGAGYGFRAAVNVPVGDAFAFRASAFTRRDPGYIDDSFLHIEGINRVDVDGGRLAALWRPSKELSLKVSALFQETKAFGPSLQDPTLGDLQQSLTRGSGGYDNKIQAYSAVLDTKLGSADVTAITGYNVGKNIFKFDLGPLLGSFFETGNPDAGFAGFGVTGVPSIESLKTEKFTQEIRATGHLGELFDWLVGAFYDHEYSPQTQIINASDFTTGEVVAQFGNIDFPSSFTEYAGFADFTVHFSDRLDVQIGGRESHNRQTYSSNVSGLYCPVFLGSMSPCTLTPSTRSTDNSFTYLFTPRFKLSPNLMIYARLASGYRPGGPNTASNVSGTSLPTTYKPDKTENYELGVKGDALDHALSFDASIYYISWKDIQLQLADPTTGLGYSANGSEAKSQGLELSVSARPLTGLTVSAWASFGEAVLTRSFPSTSLVYGAEGDRLPGSSRFSGSLSAEQTFPLMTATTGFVGGSVSYMGEQLGVFNYVPPVPPPRQVYPSYARGDVRIGVRREQWTIGAYVNNLTDRRAAIAGGTGTTFPNLFQYIQPRTAGLNAEWRF